MERQQITVSMSLDDFNHLNWYKEQYHKLREELHACTAQKWSLEPLDELGGCGTLVVDTERVKSLLFDHAAEDCELDSYDAKTINWEYREPKSPNNT